MKAADEKGFCLALRDGAIAKYFLRNKYTEENEFSVSLNISKVLKSKNVTKMRKMIYSMLGKSYFTDFD